MANFGVTFNKGAASVQGVGYLLAAAASPHRCKLYDVSFGCSATPPTSTTFVHVIQRCTTVPTGATKTPNALDPADTYAASTVADDTITVDGTLTAAAFLYELSLNQLSTFRWVAREGSELVIPAVSNNGLMIGLSAVSTTTFGYGAIFQEQ